MEKDILGKWTQEARQCIHFNIWENRLQIKTEEEIGKDISHIDPHHTVIMGDFHIPLSPLDRSIQKENWETLELNNIIYQILQNISTKHKRICLLFSTSFHRNPMLPDHTRGDVGVGNSIWYRSFVSLQVSYACVMAWLGPLDPQE